MRSTVVASARLVLGLTSFQLVLFASRRLPQCAENKDANSHECYRMGCTAVDCSCGASLRRVVGVLGRHLRLPGGRRMYFSDADPVCNWFPSRHADIPDGFDDAACRPCSRARMLA